MSWWRCRRPGSTCAPWPTSTMSPPPSDITTTGTTLAANGLKIVDDGVILRSQANLVAARNAAWGASERETARVILDRVAAQARARNYREVRARFAACDAKLVESAK